MSSDRLADLEWCHIDAYDDVPLTSVVRTGEPIFGDLDELEPRFAEVVARQREERTVALAAVPLPGLLSPVGGILLCYGSDQPFTVAGRAALEVLAERIADAVRRVRAGEPLETAPTRESATGATSGHRAEVQLDSDPRSAGAARRFLRRELEAWGVGDDTIESAQLCLSELVTNVVIHAHSGAELTVRIEHDQLVVVVRDLGGEAGAAAPALPTAEELAVFGRGLMLVEALADRWGSERDARGTTAWFAHDLAPDLAAG